MRLALSFIKLLALCIAILFNNSALALENVTLQLKWTHQFQFAGYYAAQAKGYYREAGLDVHFEVASPKIDVVDRVLMNEAQFGIGSSSLLLTRAAGKPVVALAVIFQHTPYAIFAAKNNNINNLLDLVGKRVMFDHESNELLALFKKAGINTDTLIHVQHSLDPQDLIHGKVDAISGYLSNKPFDFEHANFSYQTFTPQMFGMDFYGDTLFTSEHEIINHPERVHAFREASLRGWLYAIEHRDEIIELILSQYSQKQSREHLAFEANQMITLMETNLIEVGYSNPKRWEQIANTFGELNMMPRNFQLTGFLYDPDGKLDSNRVSHSLGFTLLMMSLALATAIFMLLFNRRFKRNAQKLATLNQQQLAHSRIFELLFKNAPLAEVLNAIAKQTELQDPQLLCSILLLSDDRKHLHIGAAPSLPSFYNDAVDGLAIGLNVGSCGMAAYSGKRAVSEDITSHPNWAPFKDLVIKAGLFSCWSEPLKSTQGKILGTFAVYRKEAHATTDSDIELIQQTTQLTSIVIEKFQYAQALQISHDLLSKISAEVPGIIFQARLYPSGRFCFPFVSEAVRKMNGVMPESLREDASIVFNNQHPDDPISLKDAVYESAKELTSLNIEYRVTLPVIGRRWRAVKAQPEKHEDGSVIWHGLITDITDNKDAEERIHHMAQYDQLTDLPNRALLSDRLQQALSIAKRKQTRLALLFLDFDKFKPINDSLGHAVGDLLLKKAAVRMQHCMRESDTVARIGGDEFVVLIPNVETEEDAQLVAEKIRLSLELPFEIEGHVLNISTSIGIAIYPEQGEDEIELSKNADLAMYFAKQSGRNTIKQYHSGMKVAGQ
ncbi:MAG: diguanylate cyclase [Gallionellaceae bacterium]